MEALRYDDPIELGRVSCRQATNQSGAAGGSAGGGWELTDAGQCGGKPFAGVEEQIGAMTTTVATARSFLFVPGDRPDRFDKAAASGADLVILDLEDAVAPERKTLARQQVRGWLTAGRRAVVRINGADTEWYEPDVTAVAATASAVMLPKAEDVGTLTDLVRRLPPETEIIPLLETAAGIANAHALCAVPGVTRPAFGSIDLAAQLGIDPASTFALSHARSAVVLAAAAAGRAAPIDGVTADVTDEAVLRADIKHAVELGFTAKLCIHPRQLAAVHTGFAPSDDDIEWAQQILAVTQDGSVTVHNGQMVDRPVLLRAKAILARASRTARG